MVMKYIITEKQLKYITEQESEYKGKVNMVHIYLDLPFPKNPTRDTHPHLYKTKYTSDGHPIPLRTPKIEYVTLANPNTDEIYGAKYPDTKSITLSACLGPDKEVYIFTPCDNSGYLCLGHINKSYVTSYVNANDTFDEEGLNNLEKEFLNLFEKGKIIELVIKEGI